MRLNTMLRKDAHLLVIGGARGLGFELARTASEQGARVTVTGRDAHVADARAAELGPSARGLACDLLDAASLGRLFTDIDAVDHLVLTAIERDHNTVADFRADAAARMMLIKTVGYANAVAHALPKLDPDGSVVLFSGLSMWRPSPGSTTMSMANSAILGLVNSLAAEIAPVRVNAITPGSVAGTEAIDNADPVLADSSRRSASARRPNGCPLPVTSLRRAVPVDLSRRQWREPRRGRRSAPALARRVASVHDTFILGLPGETKETIAFAWEVNPHTLQVSVAAPYPGHGAVPAGEGEGWLTPDADDVSLVSSAGCSWRRYPTRA